MESPLVEECRGEEAGLRGPEQQSVARGSTRPAGGEAVAPDSRDGQVVEELAQPVEKAGLGLGDGGERRLEVDREGDLLGGSAADTKGAGGPSPGGTTAGAVGSLRRSRSCQAASPPASPRVSTSSASRAALAASPPAPSPANVTIVNSMMTTTESCGRHGSGV